MPTSLLIAGASGSIGFELVKRAHEDGHAIRTFSRSAKRLSPYTQDMVTGDGRTFRQLENVCRGMDVVISALGASVSPDSPEKAGFREVDTLINLRLLEAARACKVRRFIYVSVRVEAGYARTTYVRAHEEVVEAIADSGLSYCIIRPTGVFSALASLLKLARKGFIPRIGSGLAKTNPVHEADVAELIIRNLKEGPKEIGIGGPDTLTRKEIAAMAFAAAGQKPRSVPVTPGLLKGAAGLMKLWNPRMGELTEFATAVSTVDCLAPAIGFRRLKDYFRERA